MTYPRNFEYRLHELDEDAGSRAALLSDMGDTYPELRLFFARVEALIAELEDKKMDALEAKLAKAGEALTSIAVNTCCGGCQEAALVARAALSREGGEW